MNDPITIGDYAQFDEGLICPQCRAEYCYWRECVDCGGDGAIDLHDEDDVNYALDTLEDCATCKGAGVERWCFACGYGGDGFYRRKAVPE